MVRLGFRASSLSTGDCSKPTNPVSAITASTPPVPAPAAVMVDGDSAPKSRWPPAGRASPEIVSTRTMMISAAVSTASTRPATSTRARPSAATSAQNNSAHAHHGRFTCRWAAASAWAVTSSAP